MKTFQEFVNETLILEGPEEIAVRKSMTPEQLKEYSDLQRAFIDKRVKEVMVDISNQFRKLFYSENGKQKVMDYLSNKIGTEEMFKLIQ